MAIWKKVIVSGSSAELANLAVDSLSSGVVTGAVGNLTTTAINGTGNIVATTNASGLTHSGSFSGSFEGDGSQLTGLVSTLTIDADAGGTSTVDLQSQTLDIAGTANEIETSVSAQTISVGIVTNPTLSGNVTITGNLEVQGTQTNLNTTNLDVEDRYILLNSGSATIGDSGIIFGAANGVAQSGTGLVWDASYNSNDGRLAIVNTLASNATGDTTPNYHIAGVFEGTIANAATAQADHVGNIRVESGDIFIYV